MLPPSALQALQAIYDEIDIIWGAQAALMAVDESHAVIPHPLCVLTPRNHDQVVQTIAWARVHAIAIVPSGGRTGLSGGACAGNGELVLSLSRMNNIIAFDVDAGVITVEAGLVLETLQNTVAEKGWFYPVDYASRGSAQMGGAVATNAGGIRVLRYGMTRNWVVGLKAVTGTAETLCIDRHLEKDNAGYDLKNLLIGSEGTLAVITEITFKLARPMLEQTTLLIGFADLQSMLPVFLNLHKYIDLNAAEFFCFNALRHVIHKNKLDNPFDTDYKFYLLIECDKNEATLDFIAGLLGQYDVIMSHNHQQARALWQYRELISSAINVLKPYKNDIACNLAKVQDWLADLEQGFMQVNAGLEFVWFGHLGDGNVHLNVIKPENVNEPEFEIIAQQCAMVIKAVTKKYSATASAEHGIGLLKKDLLASSRSSQEIVFFQHIKQIFDPAGILNPGKLL